MVINFYLDKRTDKKGDAPIRASVSVHGIRLLTSTGLKISPAKWNAEKQKVKQGASNAAGMPYNTINSILARITERFTAFEGECLTKGVKIDADALKDILNAAVGRNEEKREASPVLTFWDCYDIFTKEMGTQNQWTKATYQKFAALKNHLMDFNGMITFDDLEETGLNAFVGFLRDALEMKNSTIGKQLGFLKWFLRWATAKGFNNNSAYQTFSPKLKTTGKKVIFLEWDELMKVMNYAIPENGYCVPLVDGFGRSYAKIVHDAAAIAKTRDIFCFCCFTSLRYSDASNLKWNDIKGDTMTLTTIKTADLITIELNKYALAILEKYRLDAPANGGYVFPRITNQRMNLYLKDLCELCEINQPITQVYFRGSERIEETRPKYELMGTHSGRRTFICNALTLGIPAEIVMKWTGHSDYKSMKPYIAIADAAKAKAMGLFNKI